MPPPINRSSTVPAPSGSEARTICRQVERRAIKDVERQPRHHHLSQPRLAGLGRYNHARLEADDQFHRVHVKRLLTPPHAVGHPHHQV
ncbi:MAG: hypothetical protein ACLQOO_23610, partial [Terriglobia bacterium]